MLKFDIIFKDQPTLHVELTDSLTAEKYIRLLKSNYSKETPIFRDVAEYTPQKLEQLLIESQAKLGWMWSVDSSGQPDRIAFHKNLENAVDKDGSFEHIPAELDSLIHELHFCLHAGQGPRNKLIIEWFNRDYLPLDDDFNFTTDMQFGDLRLQNPYVGHDPMQVYQEQDLEQVMRTCTFPDRIKPGIHINLQSRPQGLFNLERYKTWWTTNAPEFVDVHGLDRLVKYVGWAVVGKVVNINDLHTCLKADKLEFNRLEFY